MVAGCGILTRPRGGDPGEESAWASAFFFEKIGG